MVSKWKNELGHKMWVVHAYAGLAKCMLNAKCVFSIVCGKIHACIIGWYVSYSCL